MDKACKSLDDYTKIITQINDNKMFGKTFTINGKKYNLGTYFNSVDDAFEYYHKEVGGYNYVCKLHEKTGEGIEIIIENFGDIIGVQKKSANNLKDYGKEIFKDE